ncbi:hypothetical protein KLP28_08325 [Nocardioidaceae bacterium]|nr:hypothetical protein KLP28_08325 [Nocardioidaceae bacterium]
MSISRSTRVRWRTRLEHRQAGAEIVLVVGRDRFIAGHGGSAHDVVPGSRVTVTGKPTLVGDYEWDGFGLPDLRADWAVREVVKGFDREVNVLIEPVHGRFEDPSASHS